MQNGTKRSYLPHTVIVKTKRNEIMHIKLLWHLAEMNYSVGTIMLAWTSGPRCGDKSPKPGWTSGPDNSKFLWEFADPHTVDVNNLPTLRKLELCAATQCGDGVHADVTYGNILLGQAKEHLRRTVGMVNINLIIAVNRWPSTYHLLGNVLFYKQ